MKTYPVRSISSTTLLTMLILSGCATDDPDRQAKQGAAIGALTGAVIGHQIDGDKGRFLGAAVGAIAGGSVGSYQDEQQRRLERELAEEQRLEQIVIRRLEDDSLAVGISSDASFAFDSSEIRPAMYRALDKLSATAADFDRTILHVVGHTDSVGDNDYNLALSNRRAQAVAAVPDAEGHRDRTLTDRGPWGERATQLKRHSIRTPDESSG